MAQGGIVRGNQPVNDPLANLSETQRHALRQYEQIVRFKDAVLSGAHPHFKPPPDLAATQSPSRASNSTTTASTQQSGSVKQSQLPTTNGHQQGLPPSSSRAPISPPAGTKPFSSGNTEINPIFLEKSDDLIKAEIQLQRQRIERALREEVDQRRAAARIAAQGEPLVDFDLSDVLSKALTLVQATAAPLPAEENATAANQDATSDSFDDNTFYSSRHDTPESHLTSRIPDEPQEVPGPTVADGQQLSNATSGNLETERIPPQNRLDTVSHAPANLASIQQVPGLNSHIKDGFVSSGRPSPNTRAPQSQSNEPGNMEKSQQGVKYGSGSRPQPLCTDNRPPSPLIRAHELSPVAPQPAHISSLAVATRIAPAVETVSNQSSGTPAQVAALRNEPTIITSPDSSPSGGRVSEKKKGKKKKRKADRQVPETEAIPYIKPEPRSPSPLHPTSYIRPNKRQRCAQRQENEPEFEESRYEIQPSVATHEVYSSRPQRDDRVPLGYERTALYPQRSASTVVASGQPYAREYVDDRRIVGESFVIRQPSGYANPEDIGWRTADLGHGNRPQTRVVDPYGESPRSYRGVYETPRMSVRPEGERFMEAPQQPPIRIVVDSFGREYIEPPRSTVIRQSAAPAVRSDDPEIIYERTAPRTVSRHVPLESYADGSAVYQSSPPSYAMPRRVVTQPDYISQDYRSIRHREYSARPMAQPGEYVEVVAPVEKRRVEEVPREFITRATSVRPAEPLRYQVPQDYGRVQSVRPEAPVRQYAASVRPEGRREIAQTYVRDYGTRPVEQPGVRREYSVRPVEQYHEQSVRGGEEIAFIERPRGATQEIVYADDARREVYR